MDLFTMNSAVMKSFQLESGIAQTLADIVIRPGRPEDVDLIIDMHHRLSEESVYKRYHAPRIPSPAEIAKMCQLNGQNGRLLVAVLPGRRSTIVGMAYYIWSEEAVAETAFLVEDRFQGQGIGKRLIQALAQQAVAQDIQFFDAQVLPINRPMIHLLHQTGQMVFNKLSYGTREMRVRL